MTHLVDNSYVQSSIQEAVDYVSALPVSSDTVVQSKRLFLGEFLKLAKVYTASGNSIPALGGKGLEQILTVAHNVVAGMYDGDFRFDFKDAAFAFLKG